MDLERAVQFILDNQAAASAQMVEFSTRLNEVAGQMNQLTTAVGQLAQQQVDLIQHVDHFQRVMSEAVKAIAEAQARLTEAQHNTEQRLNALITIVDGLIRRPSE